MQVAGVSVPNWLAGKLSPQRLTAAAAVLVIHILLLLVLFSTGYIPVPPALKFHEQQITIWLKPPPPQKPQARPVLPPPAPVPLIDEILKRLRSIEVSPPPPSSAPAYYGLRAFGEYLYNCSGARYERLAPGQWEQCLGQYLPRRAPALGLGAENSSLWQAQRDEAAKPEAPMESACPQGALNSNLGLPCHHFSGSLLGGSQQPAQ